MPLNSTIFNPSLYIKIRNIWFAGLPNGATVPPQELMHGKWFPRDTTVRDEFDNVCKNAFEDALLEIGPERRSDLEAVGEELMSEIENGTDDTDSANTALSIVLLLDQISRNRFRETETLPLVYNHYDSISQFLVARLLSRSSRVDHSPLIRYSCAKRIWFYMPLMHSERSSDHERMVSLLDEFKADLQEKDDHESLEYLSMNSSFEQKHKKIIDQFGRYPYRNALLGRTSTKEEEEWLKDGETFGVSG